MSLQKSDKCPCFLTVFSLLCPFVPYSKEKKEKRKKEKERKKKTRAALRI